MFKYFYFFMFIACMVSAIYTLADDWETTLRFFALASLGYLTYVWGKDEIAMEKKKKEEKNNLPTNNHFDGGI